MKNRREFIALASTVAAACLSPCTRVLEAQETGPLSLEAGGLRFKAMPADFTGLSYETPQLYNPQFFSRENTALVAAFIQLSNCGVLRMGGNLSDLARWNGPSGDFATEKQRAAIEQGKTYWEWKLTDESVRAHRDGAITPEAIRNLRGFLDATNWRLIYGLNFGSGSAARAAHEAAYVAREMGSRLVSFQVGNESDFFAGNHLFRERGFNFDAYLSGYKEFVRAVREKVPNAPFSGPDTAKNLGWVERFGQRAGKPIVLLTSHYYAMGPAKDPAMDAARLLSPNPELERQIGLVQQAVMDAGGVPLRMTEGNSCFGGGKPDVSDAFASALWGADYMLHVASAGYAGVNLHGGGDGFYTPIETLTDRSATPRPLFYGMQFANEFVSDEIARYPLPTEIGVTAYVGRSPSGSMRVGLINKSPKEVRLRVPADLKKREISKEITLIAPGLAAKKDISFAETEKTRGGVFALAPYSARLVLWT